MATISATGSIFGAATFKRISTGISAFEIDRLEYAMGVLEVLLVIRFLFNLFNASALNLLDKLVEAVTFPFTAPFLLFFGKGASYALSRNELSALAAMIAYPLIVWTIMFAAKRSRAETHAEAPEPAEASLLGKVQLA